MGDESSWERGDLLAVGREATDDAIVGEVLTNCHVSKQAIPRERWVKALGWMCEEGLAPGAAGGGA